jgi:hypothetical protein
MKTNLSRIATPLRHTHHVGELLRDSIQRRGEMLLLVTILSWVVCPCLAQEVEKAPAELVAAIPLVPSDPEALELAEKIHCQATAIDKLSSFVVRTERRTSFHDYRQGVIGLQDERSLELLHKAIDVQLDTPPKSVNEMVVGWHDKQFVWRKHGVCIHTPPEGKQPISGDQIKPAVPGASPYAGGRLDQTVYIELIIDGEIVDLNRIQLPADTPIIDERFAEPANK